jgi:hypothetical protein
MRPPGNPQDGTITGGIVPAIIFFFNGKVAAGRRAAS